MPEFAPGESKTAIVTMSNPTSKPFDYLAELYMGTDLALMAGEDFHLEAEESKDISLSVAMPSTPGTYPVHIGVFSGGESIGLYKATEDVIIKPVAAVVTIALRNYPAIQPNMIWRFFLWDRYDDGKCLWVPQMSDFAQRITFSIPLDYVFPLRFECDIYIEYTGEIVYAVQSLSPVFPSYVEEFVPSYGNYYFNIATSKFEKI